ncbi:MAG: ketoacyl-ACP synthase III [Legionellales bacterium]|nr:ketoacyl-ACP synthase III [Legionellales bacterium]
MSSTILGTGGYLPEEIRTNHDIARLVDTSDEWIRERTGIRERHIASPSENVSDLAYYASQEAILNANISASQIDLIIVASTTGEKVFPSTACLVQKKLGISGCPAFDINAACAGFNYALAIADNFIRGEQARTVLVVGAEIMSRLVNWHDRSTCILFGDGAGAVILQRSDKPGILSTHIHADGFGENKLYTTNPQCNAPALPTQSPYLVMQGNDVFKLAVKRLGDVIEETLLKNNIQQHEIDWLIPHQANIRIIQAMAKKLNLPLTKVILTIEYHGNTSSASVPLALNEAVKDGRIQRGQLLLLESFGAGFTWGSTLIRF